MNTENAYNKDDVVILVDGQNLHYTLKNASPPLQERDIDWGRFFKYMASRADGYLKEVKWFMARKLLEAEYRNEWRQRNWEEKNRNLKNRVKTVTRHLKNFQWIQIQEAGYIKLNFVGEDHKALHL